METPGEIFQLLAFGGIDDADALEGGVQALGNFRHFGRIAQHDGRAQPQRVKLPGRLQDARLRAFGKHNPLRMPLQFFDDVADETHGRKFSGQWQNRKSTMRENLNLPPGTAAH